MIEAQTRGDDKVFFGVFSEPRRLWDTNPLGRDCFEAQGCASRCEAGIVESKWAILLIGGRPYMRDARWTSPATAVLVLLTSFVDRS